LPPRGGGLGWGAEALATSEAILTPHPGPPPQGGRENDNRSPQQGMRGSHFPVRFSTPLRLLLVNEVPWFAQPQRCPPHDVWPDRCRRVASLTGASLLPAATGTPRDQGMVWVALRSDPAATP